MSVYLPCTRTLVSGDPALRWDFYVSHYQDQQQAIRDPKYSYDTPNGEYTGLTPPSGMKQCFRISLHFRKTNGQQVPFPKVFFIREPGRLVDA